MTKRFQDVFMKSKFIKAREFLPSELTDNYDFMKGFHQINGINKSRHSFMSVSLSYVLIRYTLLNKQIISRSFARCLSILWQYKDIRSIGRLTTINRITKPTLEALLGCKRYIAHSRAFLWLWNEIGMVAFQVVYSSIKSSSAKYVVRSRWKRCFANVNNSQRLVRRQQSCCRVIVIIECTQTRCID